MKRKNFRYAVTRGGEGKGLLKNESGDMVFFWKRKKMTIAGRKSSKRKKLWEGVEVENENLHVKKNM